ncbi:MAG: hypothetical protein ABW060_09155, partial [Solirubrobacteraceae bacterium]
QIALATVAAGLLTFALLYLGFGHRSGRVAFLGRLAAQAERHSGLPGWAALPAGIATVSLLTALFGMYWDISLHIDNGRDAGPLANPAHHLILAGLFGIFAAGVLAIMLPGAKAGPAALGLGGGRRAPVGGILMAGCGAFALAGFPLDDVWHRLFGQDVTLWGPTHLMLIGGAGMTLIAQAVLLQEGLRARPGRRGARFSRGRLAAGRRIALMGGLLIGLSTFQAEFDFGVPQYRAVLQPALIALAGGVALVAARVWAGPGGALGATAFYLVVRGGVTLLVGPVFGQTAPSLPLFVGAALAVEAAAPLLRRRGPLAFGAAGGLLVGTAGFATEWGWTHLVYRLPWEPPLLPEGLVLAAVAGVAAGLLGGLIGSALRGELPRAAVARPVAAASFAVLVLVLADGLHETAPAPVGARVATSGDGVTVRLDPAAAADDATWLQVTAWQGGGLVVDRLRRRPDGSWSTTRPIPSGGDWKVVLRLQRGRAVTGAPVSLPADAAIPVGAVPAPGPAGEARAFVPDRTLLQRERKGDIPAWLWAVASVTVLAIATSFLGALAWGLGRVARATRPPAPAPRRFVRDPAVALEADV